MKLIMSFLRPFEETEIKRVAEDDMINLEKSIEALFLFTLIWSIGCTGDYDSRIRFNHYIREKIEELTPSVVFPEDGNVYEFEYSIVTRAFTKWSDRNKEFTVD